MTRTPRLSMPPTISLTAADAALALLKQEIAKMLQLDPDLKRFRFKIAERQHFNDTIVALHKHEKSKHSKEAFVMPFEAVPDKGVEPFEISFTDTGKDLFVTIVRR